MNNELLAALLQHPLYGQGSPVSPQQYQAGTLDKGLQSALSNKGLFGLRPANMIPGTNITYAQAAAPGPGQIIPQ